jgi:hypothetical protein
MGELRKASMSGCLKQGGSPKAGSAQKLEMLHKYSDRSGVYVKSLA